MNEEIIALLTKEKQLRINGKMMTLTFSRLLQCTGLELRKKILFHENFF